MIFKHLKLYIFPHWKIWSGDSSSRVNGALETAHKYPEWMVDRLYALVPAQAIVGNFLMTSKDFPSCENRTSLVVDQVIEKLRARQIEN